MYAVIETGGKQYRVELGSEIQVDRLDVQPGQDIELDRVLLVVSGDETAVGRPVVDGAHVSATVLSQDRGDKVIVFKYKPKARTRVKKGFRAELTRLRIADITFAGSSAADDAASSVSREATAARQAERAAADKAAADRELAARLAATEEMPEPAAKPGTAAKATGKAATAAKAKAAPAAARTDVGPARRRVTKNAEAGSGAGQPEATSPEATSPEAPSPEAAPPRATPPADDAPPAPAAEDTEVEGRRED